MRRITFPNFNRIYVSLSVIFNIPFCAEADDKEIWQEIDKMYNASVFKDYDSTTTWFSTLSTAKEDFITLKETDKSKINKTYNPEEALQYAKKLLSPEHDKVYGNDKVGMEKMIKEWMNRHQNGNFLQPLDVKVRAFDELGAGAKPISFYQTMGYAGSYQTLHKGPGNNFFVQDIAATNLNVDYLNDRGGQGPIERSNIRLPYHYNTLKSLTSKKAVPIKQLSAYFNRSGNLAAKPSPTIAPTLRYRVANMKTGPEVNTLRSGKTEFYVMMKGVKIHYDLPGASFWEPGNKYAQPFLQHETSTKSYIRNNFKREDNVLEDKNITIPPARTGVTTEIAPIPKIEVSQAIVSLRPTVKVSHIDDIDIDMYDVTPPSWDNMPTLDLFLTHTEEKSTTPHHFDEEKVNPHTPSTEKIPEDHRAILRARELMATHHLGYLSGFVCTITEIISVHKDQRPGRELAIAAAKSVQHAIHGKRFVHMGMATQKAIETYPALLAAPSLMLKDIMNSVHLVFLNHSSLSPEARAILEEIEGWYTIAEGEDLLKMLVAVEEYPNQKHTAANIMDNVLNYLLEPYMRLRGTLQRQAVLDKIEVLLSSRRKELSIEFGNIVEKLKPSNKRAPKHISKLIENERKTENKSVIDKVTNSKYRKPIAGQRDFVTKLSLNIVKNKKYREMQRELQNVLNDINSEKYRKPSIKKNAALDKYDKIFTRKQSIDKNNTKEKKYNQSKRTSFKNKSKFTNSTKPYFFFQQYDEHKPTITKPDKKITKKRDEMNLTYKLEPSLGFSFISIPKYPLRELSKNVKNEDDSSDDIVGNKKIKPDIKGKFEDKKNIRKQKDKKSLINKNKILRIEPYPISCNPKHDTHGVLKKYENKDKVPDETNSEATDEISDYCLEKPGDESTGYSSEAQSMTKNFNIRNKDESQKKNSEALDEISFVFMDDLLEQGYNNNQHKDVKIKSINGALKSSRYPKLNKSYTNITKTPKLHKFKNINEIKNRNIIEKHDTKLKKETNVTLEKFGKTNKMIQKLNASPKQEPTKSVTTTLTSKKEDIPKKHRYKIKGNRNEELGNTGTDYAFKQNFVSEHKRSKYIIDAFNSKEELLSDKKLIQRFKENFLETSKLNTKMFALKQILKESNSDQEYDLKFQLQNALKKGVTNMGRRFHNKHEKILKNIREETTENDYEELYKKGIRKSLGTIL